MKGTTSTGFEFDIPNKRFENLELIDMLGKVDTDPTILGRLLTLLLGEDTKQAMYDHIRDEDGIVPFSAAELEITDMFKAYAEQGESEKK